MPRPAPKFIWQKLATNDWIEANGAALQEATDGSHAVVEDVKKVRLRIEFFCGNNTIARDLKRAFGGSILRLPENWEAQWFSAHRTKLLRIGKRLTIASEPGDAATDTPRLVIPASTAFGTGEHATTAMSLRLLEGVTRGWPTGWSMLDAGTGSGILALAGRAFGASDVLAIDNDPLAIKTAKWNARENGIRGVDFRVGDVTRALAGRFDLIAANLFSELLIAVLPRFKRAIKRDGCLILSGVMRTQEPAVRRALRANGFRVEIARRRGKWVAIFAESPSYSPPTIRIKSMRGAKTQLTRARLKSTFRHPLAGLRSFLHPRG
ncbi:MAG: 50S ribosomal protein L11 methyltransferase [Chthoniobacterales bacterium]